MMIALESDNRAYHKPSGEIRDLGQQTAVAGPAQGQLARRLGAAFA